MQTKHRDHPAACAPVATKSKPKSRLGAGQVVLVISSVLVALTLAELVIRVCDLPPRPLPPLPIPSYQLSPHAGIGYEYRPGYRPTDEPFDRSHLGYSINQAGFRDRDYPQTKPHNVFRVIVLGDSITAGNGIRDVANTFTKRLETRLNAAAAKHRFQVMNMAVGGYHTMQEIETLRHKGLVYQPDLVVVAVCVNDFTVRADGGVWSRLRKANHQSLSTTDRSFYARLVGASRLAFMLHYSLRSAHDAHHDWYEEHVLQGRSPVDAGFALLAKLQSAHAFQTAIVIVPEFSAPFSAYRSQHIHDQVVAAAKPHGLTVIDLLPAFAALSDDASAFSRGDALHLNQAGHEAMADILLPIVQKTDAL